MSHEISDVSDFEQNVVNAGVPVLVDFWAPWCGPCVNLAPTLEEISEDGIIKVVKVNVDENQTLAVDFRIQSIPALMIFNGEEVIASRVGSGSKQDLVNWIQSNI